MSSAVWIEVVVGRVGGGGARGSEEGGQGWRRWEGCRRPIIEWGCEEVRWLV